MELSTASELRRGAPRAVLANQSVTCSLHCALPCSKSTTLSASQQASFNEPQTPKPAPLRRDCQ